MHIHFEWDREKDALNQIKHSVSFAKAQRAFVDPRRIVQADKAHSTQEERFYCYGDVDGEILTVRFTMRGDKVRIIGAGPWRKGRGIYEAENSLHRRAARD